MDDQSSKAPVNEPEGSRQDDFEEFEDSRTLNQDVDVEESLNLVTPS